MGEGGPDRAWWRSWRGAVIGIAGIVVLAGVLDNGPRGAAPPDKAPKAAAVDSRPIVAVRAEQLARAASGNEVAAVRRYESSRIRVSGTVAAVRRGADGAPIVVLDGGPGRIVAAGLVADQVDAAAQLGRGRAAVLLCGGLGLDRGRALLVECRLAAAE